MGCGSILGDLFYIADALLEPHPLPLPRLGGGERGEGVDLHAQLYNMYGEGQISEEVFTALKALAERGQLRPADLAVHRLRARRLPPHKKDVELANALRGLRSRLAQLERTRETSAGVLADLEARMERLDQRIAGKEQAARQSLEHDEEAARRRLAEKAELNASYARLSAQAQALRDDLARLDDLQAQLEAKKFELEALQARGALAEISNTKEV